MDSLREAAAKDLAAAMDIACMYSMYIIPNKSEWHRCDKLTAFNWGHISLFASLTDEFVKEFILQLDLENVLINPKGLSEDTIKYVKLLKEMGGRY